MLQNKAALTIALENLGYTDIRSPIDGRIGLTAFTTAIWSIPPAACWRRSSARTRSMSSFRSASARSRISGPSTTGARQPDQYQDLGATCQRQEYPPSRRLEFHRQPGRSADRYADHARNPAQSRAAAGGWRVRHRPDQGERRAAAAGDAAGGAAARPGRASYVLVVNADNKVESGGSRPAEAVDTDIASPRA